MHVQLLGGLSWDWLLHLVPRILGAELGIYSGKLDLLCPWRFVISHQHYLLVPFVQGDASLQLVIHWVESSPQLMYDSSSSQESKAFRNIQEGVGVRVFIQFTFQWLRECLFLGLP